MTTAQVIIALVRRELDEAIDKAPGDSAYSLLTQTIDVPVGRLAEWSNSLRTVDDEIGSAWALLGHTYADRYSSLAEALADVAKRLQKAENPATYSDGWNAAIRYMKFVGKPPRESFNASPWALIATAPRDRRFLGGWMHGTYGWLWDGCRWHDDAHSQDGGYFVAEGGGVPTHWFDVPPPPEVTT